MINGASMQLNRHVHVGDHLFTHKKARDSCENAKFDARDLESDMISIRVHLSCQADLHFYNAGVYQHSSIHYNLLLFFTLSTTYRVLCYMCESDLVGLFTIISSIRPIIFLAIFSVILVKSPEIFLISLKNNSLFRRIK